jgi:hypothetical protein
MDTFYYLALHAHSGWRWIVLVLLLIVIGKSHIGWKKKLDFTAKEGKLGLFAMIAFHIQFLGGLVLYFISPKVQFVEGMMGNKVLRFFTMEHSVMMIIAMALITIGHVKSKKAEDSLKKYKAQAIYFTIAFVVVIASIPWPFREQLMGSWF